PELISSFLQNRMSSAQIKPCELGSDHSRHCQRSEAIQNCRQRVASHGRASRFLHLPREMRLHRRPLAGNDAVDAGVAKRSVVCYLMAAQGASELCATSLDSTAALMIKKMRWELDRDAAQRVEGMAEKQELALGIELRPLHAFPVPGPANLQPAVIRFDVQI